MNKEIVVVTTDKDKRGVFCGELVSKDDDKVVLANARMAVYWPSDNRGVVGLAAIGPQKGSRITPAAPQISLNGVTAVMNCTPEAVKLWESEPWN